MKKTKILDPNSIRLQKRTSGKIPNKIPTKQIRVPLIDRFRPSHKPNKQTFEGGDANLNSNDAGSILENTRANPGAQLGSRGGNFKRSYNRFIMNGHLPISRCVDPAHQKLKHVNPNEKDGTVSEITLRFHQSMGSTETASSTTTASKNPTIKFKNQISLPQLNSQRTTYTGNRSRPNSAETPKTKTKSERSNEIKAASKMDSTSTLTFGSFKTEKSKNPSSEKDMSSILVPPTSSETTKDNLPLSKESSSNTINLIYKKSEKTIPASLYSKRISSTIPASACSSTKNILADFRTEKSVTNTEKSSVNQNFEQIEVNSKPELKFDVEDGGSKDASGSSKKIEQKETEPAEPNFLKEQLNLDGTYTSKIHLPSIKEKYKGILPRYTDCPKFWKLKYGDVNYWPPCQQFKKPTPDFILNNALSVFRMPKKNPIPKCQDHVSGKAKHWLESGLARQYIYKDDYGKIPTYLTQNVHKPCKNKKELAKILSLCRTSLDLQEEKSC